MTSRARVLSRYLLLFAVAAGAFGCDDESPTNPTTTTTAPVTPPPSGSARLRVAQLTQDARTVDVLLNGAAIFTNIGYPGVSPYAELAAGAYRLQVFPAGNRRTTLVETVLQVSASEAVTAAVVGLDAIRVETFRDATGGVSGRGRVRLVNAVPDYPGPFDLGVRNGPRLVAGVGYTAASNYAEVIPGIYDLEVLRSQTTEVVATDSGRELRSGASYTIFAVGTLRRRDIEVFIALDAG